MNDLIAILNERFKLSKQQTLRPEIDNVRADMAYDTKYHQEQVAKILARKAVQPARKV